MRDEQYKLIVDAARARGATFPRQVDWLAFKAAIDAAVAGHTAPPRPAPTPTPPKPPAAPPAASGGLPDDYWPMLARIESGNRPYVKAATSSASGLYQFLKATWIGEGGKWGSDSRKAFGGLTPSTAEQTQRAKTFTAKNAAVLRRAGIPINKATLYAAHFLGAGTAVKLLAAHGNSRADHIAGAAPTKANRSILENKTVSQFLDWLRRKTGEAAR